MRELPNSPDVWHNNIKVIFNPAATETLITERFGNVEI